MQIELRKAANNTGNSTGSSNDTEVASAKGNSSKILNSTKKASAEEVEPNSVADVYPYWRATREKPISKNDEEEKKPYEPRPAKFKENYEDKGLKVFKPDFKKIGKVVTDNYKTVGGDKESSSSSTKTEDATSDSSSEEKGKTDGKKEGKDKTSKKGVDK